MGRKLKGMVRKREKAERVQRIGCKSKTGRNVTHASFDDWLEREINNFLNNSIGLHHRSLGPAERLRHKAAFPFQDSCEFRCNWKPWSHGAMNPSSWLQKKTRKLKRTRQLWGSKSNSPSRAPRCQSIYNRVSAFEVELRGARIFRHSYLEPGLYISETWAVLPTPGSFFSWMSLCKCESCGRSLERRPIIVTKAQTACRTWLCCKWVLAWWCMHPSDFPRFCIEHMTFSRHKWPRSVRLHYGSSQITITDIYTVMGWIIVVLSLDHA